MENLDKIVEEMKKFEEKHNLSCAGFQVVVLLGIYKELRYMNGLTEFKLGIGREE